MSDTKRLVTDAEAAALWDHVAEPCGSDHTEGLHSLLDTREVLIEALTRVTAVLASASYGGPSSATDDAQRLLDQLRAPTEEEPGHDGPHVLLMLPAPTEEEA